MIEKIDKDGAVYALEDAVWRALEAGLDEREVREYVEDAMREAKDG